MRVNFEYEKEVIGSASLSSLPDVSDDMFLIMPDDSRRLVTVQRKYWHVELSEPGTIDPTLTSQVTIVVE